MSSAVQEILMGHLRDVHALEEQSIQQLESAPRIAGEVRLAEALAGHLEETRGHERLLRGLLETRDSGPSRIEDAFMRAGGQGFVLFARSQRDTPGKLATHALSYEALEWAAYDLLDAIASEAGDLEVLEVARSIRDEERAMMDRIEGLFDATVEASLRPESEKPLREQLARYIADAHAIEAQAIRLMDSGRELVEDPTWTELLGGHLVQERHHEQILEERLRASRARPSKVKDLAMALGGLNWALFFRLQPATTARFGAFAYAFQHLEIGGYEHLRRVAERAGDDATRAAAAEILQEERTAAARFADALGVAVGAVVSS